MFLGGAMELELKCGFRRSILRLYWIFLLFSISLYCSAKK